MLIKNKVVINIHDANEKPLHPNLMKKIPRKENKYKKGNTKTCSGVSILSLPLQIISKPPCGA